MKQPSKLCQSLLIFCGCSAKKPAKALKASVAYDIEGDFYPDEFAPRVQLESKEDLEEKSVVKP